MNIVTSTSLDEMPLTVEGLARQNQYFQGTGGVSQENSAHGFLPAFLDTWTDTVHRARFADGRPAPLHILDGLPPELVLKRSECGRVTEVAKYVEAGFVHRGRFYTREQAAEALTNYAATEGRAG